ncbi:methyl-accepting chemotaxis protein [Sphaerotilus hippei]|uniref:Methyl-accepting chemotaxis protein n=1 Tax=Sphaerotilus hippei TaxID=744406 RepID=A0A318GZC3_9BURK|nr:methyl-accepting chemotaxis protein [Sphaerotilus hippei]PXW95498.1 methyl-accepting chemotaxis protein [Sphaerotilus hippei]
MTRPATAPMTRLSEPVPGSTPTGPRPLLTAVLVAALCGAGAWLSTLGGAWQIAAPLLTSLLAAGVVLRHAGGDRRPAGTDDTMNGSQLLVRQVIPVWQRHIQASRKQAEDGVAALLGSFSSLSDGLSQAARNAEGARGSLGAGVTDELLKRHEQAIGALLGPMREAEAQRQRMYEQLVAFTDDLAELVQHAKEVRQLASHTKLVAFNASIEAHRAGRQDHGFQAVAKEVQTLATRSDAAGQRIGSGVSRLNDRIAGLKREAALQSGSDEELRLSARQQARLVIGLLLDDLAESLQSSRELRDLSVRLSGDMDQVFMGFQYQDRFNQMMDIIERDMQRLTEWAISNGQASQADAARWLDDLERTYTMEEQRSHHHGTVDIQRNTGVEFF